MTKVQKLFFLNPLPYNLPITWLLICHRYFLTEITTSPSPENGGTEALEPDPSPCAGGTCTFQPLALFLLQDKSPVCSCAISWQGIPQNSSVLPLTKKRSKTTDLCEVLWDPQITIWVFWLFLFFFSSGSWKMKALKSRVLLPSSWIQGCSQTSEAATDPSL